MSDLLNQASLVMIPSGYKEDTVFSQLPQDGSGDLSFTRASNGTRINSAGLVEVCPWNLVGYSEQFTNSVWAKYNGTTTTANTTTAPNGTLTADTLEKLGGSGGSNYYYAVTTTNSFEQLTNFFYVKHKSGSGIVWLLGKNSGTFAFFDVINGTALSKSSGMTTSIESVGNGWYKCIFSQSYVGATSTEFGIGLCLVDGTPNYNATSAATQSVYIWGAQSAVGSTAKPYFPTTDRLNVPRLTYQNGGGGCPSLLLEKQSTNLLSYSEDFSNGYWELGSVATITTNTIVSPDGTQNADTLTANGTGSLFVRRNVYLGTAQTCSNSLFVKKANNRYVGFRNSGTTSAHDVFDFDTKTWTNNSGATLSYDELPNGWFRIKSTNTDAVNLNYYWSVIPAVNTSGVESTTASNLSVYIWGGQAEQNANYITSYIPTTSSSATRVADDITNAFLQSGGFLGSATGAMFVSGTAYSLGQIVCNFVLTADNNTTKSFLFDTSGGNSIRIRTFDASSNAQSLTSGAITGNYKLCVSWTSSTIKFFLNGSLIGTISQTAYPYTTIKQESISFSNNIWNEVVFFPTNIADADAIALTS